MMLHQLCKYHIVFLVSIVDSSVCSEIVAVGSEGEKRRGQWTAEGYYYYYHLSTFSCGGYLPPSTQRDPRRRWAVFTNRP